MKNYIALGLGLALLFGGCSKKGSANPSDTYEQQKEVEPVSPEPAGGIDASAPKGKAAGLPEGELESSGSSYTTTAGEQAVELPERMVAYSCNYSFETKEFDPAVEQITAIPDAFGGYIANSNIYKTDENSWYGVIVIKVPSDKLDQAEQRLRSIKGLKLESYNKSSEDVTEEFLDLQIRIENKKRLAERLRRLLDKTSYVRDALEVERELSRVTEEIERMEGRMKYLQGITSYSRIEVVVHEPYAETPLDTKTGPGRFLKKAFEIGINLASFVVAAVVVLLVGATPIFLLALVIWFFVWILIKRKRRKKG